MPETVPINYGIKFKDDFEMTLQQMRSVLDGAFRDDPDLLQGKYVYFDYVGETADNEVTEKYGDSPHNDVPHSRRRAFCRTYNWGRLIEPMDVRKLMKDPKNKYVMAARAARERRIERNAIAAFFADSDSVDENEAVTAVAFPAANQIAVNFQYGGGGSNAGLTLQKIVRAGELMDAGFAPKEDRYMLVGPRAFADLLLLPEVKSKDFNTDPALVKRKVVEYAGFNILESTQLNVDGSGYRRVAAWQKSCMAQGRSGPANVTGGKRLDKRNMDYLFMEYDSAALRIFEGGVIEIKCLEA